MGKLLSILTCLWLVGCHEYPKQEFILKEPLKHIVDSFVLAHPDQNVYELYIDKVMIYDSTVIIMHAGEGSLLNNENKYFNQTPIVFVLSSNGEKVDVYSGMERYIGNTRMNYDTNKWTSDREGNTCLIFDKKGEMRINDDYSYPLPFFVLPVPKSKAGQFLPPVIHDNTTEN